MLRLTAPMVLGVVSMMTLGVVDTFFVAQLGTRELAAVSFASPVTMLLISLAFGVGMAISSLTSPLIGNNQRERAARLITDGMLMAALIAVTVSLVGVLLNEPLFKAIGADVSVLPLIQDYMLIWYFAAPMLILTMAGNTALRALGDIKASAMLTLTLAFSNMILDPLLIFGIGPFPRMEVKGAALATVLASFISLVGIVFILSVRERMLLFVKVSLPAMLANWRELMKIAVPAIGANLMSPLAATLMTAIIATKGAEAVAGFGVGARVESLTLIAVFALSATLPMFVGQNIGAGKKHRAYQALIKCLRFSVILQALLYLLLLLLAPQIAAVFSSDPEVVKVITLFLMIVPVSYGAQGVVILIMVTLNVLRRPRMSLWLAVLRLMLLYLPLAYIGGEIAGVTGLFIGAAAGNMIAGVVAYRIIKRLCWELDLVPQQVSTAP